jgi:transketolase
MADNLKIDTDRLNNLRVKILKAAVNSGEGHIPSSLSILDILYCIYILLPKVSNVNFREDDFFVLSKGHAALALYAVLEEAGFIDSDWETTFCNFTSKFGGHPDMNKITGVEASTGSLGHGLPITLGKILAKRILGIKCRAICLVGDGELNEGTIWESLMLAAHHNMEELTIVIDSNGSGDRAVRLDSLESKFKAFNFDVTNINGHAHIEIVSSLMRKQENKPHVIIAQTIKGYGILEMENNPAWHHAVPNKSEIEKFTTGLK